ncbi:hypothetical protein Pmani_038453 [Petrolisthes manimaculis]|uniref:Uncharacterized protein n=1 Tax=Petrolisthes manimaculis TaxID=1843537 RepID=A0AAE1NF69_9EUCA|nr:hypothetical protein Pmani_038453 [Petrolisthes manimaculis]
MYCYYFCRRLYTTSVRVRSIETTSHKCWFTDSSSPHPLTNSFIIWLGGLFLVFIQVRKYRWWLSNVKLDQVHGVSARTRDSCWASTRSF